MRRLRLRSLSHDKPGWTSAESHVYTTRSILVVIYVYLMYEVCDDIVDGYGYGRRTLNAIFILPPSGQAIAPVLLFE